MIKGALVEIVSVGSAAAPNVIVFQFNPETLRHTLSPSSTGLSSSGQTGSSPLAVSGAPSESYSLSLSLDVTDDLLDPHGVIAQDAAKFGLYTRLAALELLTCPTNLKDLLTGKRPRTGGGVRRSTPSAQLPVVLFVWGPWRILPVRVTNLSITEKLYDAQSLNPTHAEAQIDLRVLTDEELASVRGPAATFANIAYAYTQGLRISNAARAMANLAVSAGDVISTVTNAIRTGATDVLP